jgi:mono/diheme cytochrome c family protein
MAMKRLTIAAGVVAVVAAGYVFVVAARRPMDFAGGKTVALSAYTDTNPTGAPAELAGADVVKRGEYLALAADCVACHTTEDGQPFAGGHAFPLPFGTL